jgi:hypothetical protein
MQTATADDEKGAAATFDGTSVRGRAAQANVLPIRAPSEELPARRDEDRCGAQFGRDLSR